MKFYNISDTSAFLNMVLACSGDVYWRDAGGILQDLKLAARQLKSCSWLAQPRMLNEIDVFVMQPDDGQRMIRYMMEVHCNK